MKLEFISLLSTDQLKLPGLLYSPSKPSSQVAIWLHGMGDNGVFYNPRRINTLGQSLTSHGIALLAFNNRGAHNSKRLSYESSTDDQHDTGQNYQGGTHYEKISDCVKDIDGAINFLKINGYKEFYLIGHSSGANKICVYNNQASHNMVSKYVLAGPGDDNGLFYKGLGSRKFWLALEQARQLVKQKQPLKLMPKYSGMYPFSAQAAADILDPDSAYNVFPYYEATTERLGSKRLFSEYQDINKPTLVILGEADEFTITAGGSKPALDLLKSMTPVDRQAQRTYQLIGSADHGFHNQENQFAELVSEWLIQ